MKIASLGHVPDVYDDDDRVDDDSYSQRGIGSGLFNPTK